jgi:hypothetical protein
MEYLNVLAAGVAAFAFGAVWYISMSRPWMAASGVTEEQQKSGGPMPFVVGIVAMIVVAGMMRHILAGSGVTTLGAGTLAGAGIGAFIVLPWVAMNYAFSLRPAALTLIDGVNAVVGCAIMGAVLMLF